MRWYNVPKIQVNIAHTSHNRRDFPNQFSVSKCAQIHHRTRNEYIFEVHIFQLAKNRRSQ